VPNVKNERQDFLAIAPKACHTAENAALRPTLSSLRPIVLTRVLPLANLNGVAIALAAIQSDQWLIAMLLQKSSQQRTALFKSAYLLDIIC
jgi:hypothetical protein